MLLHDSSTDRSESDMHGLHSSCRLPHLHYYSVKTLYVSMKVLIVQVCTSKLVPEAFKVIVWLVTRALCTVLLSTAALCTRLLCGVTFRTPAPGAL